MPKHSKTPIHFEFEAKPFIFIAVLAIIGILAFSVYYYEKQDNLLQSKIVLIPIHGSISLGESGGLLGQSNGADSKAIIEQLIQADKDIGIKAIILDINSPGGTVVASKEIASQVEATKKPVVAWLREVAASGAYWIAVSADKIVADPATMTGSIGVTGSYLEFSKLFEKYGVTYQQLTSGEYKDAGSPYKEMTEPEKNMLQKKINALNDMFISQVAEKRNLPKQKVRNLATGEAFLGVEAKEYGLVDELGGKSKAIDVAKQLASISGEVKLVEYKTKLGLFAGFSDLLESKLYLIGRGVGDSLTKVRKELQIYA